MGTIADNLGERQREALARLARTIPAQPTRIKVPGAFKYQDLPEGTIYVGRAVFGYPASPYGNPHSVKGCKHCAGRDHGSTEAVELFRVHLRVRTDLVAGIRRDVAGLDVACWCELDAPCHGDVILAVARGETP
jgi:hypothetical protein